jgi:excinuclease UvrABC helicase subunit UvrB
MEELKQKIKSLQSEMEMAIEEGDFTKAWELEKEIDEAQAQLMRMRETN